MNSSAHGGGNESIKDEYYVVIAQFRVENPLWCIFFAPKSLTN